MAEKGNPEAQYKVGWNYFHGEGVPQDNKEALKWYRLAVEQGHAKAQGVLGFLYLTGNGITKDHKEAFKLTSLSAKQGEAGFQYNLGLMYENGLGNEVPQDYKEAFKWYRLAVEQGFARAQTSLGGMYLYGRGVTKDLEKAKELVSLAAAQGEKNSHLETIKKDIAKAEKAERERLAAEQGLASVSACFGIYHAHATASGNKKHKNAIEQMEPLYFKAYQILKTKHDPIHKTWEADWEFGKGIGTIAIANLIKPVVRQSKIDELLEECVPVMQSAMAKIKQAVAKPNHGPAN